MDTPPVPAAGNPPAAETVIKSPRELQLETELETERQARVEAERVAAENEDRVQQLVEIDRRRPNPGAPPPKPKKKITVPGNTFFHEYEEIEVEEED